MTQARLVSAVATATGESRSTIRRRGFSLGQGGHVDLAPEDPVLALDCPFCGHPVPYPGLVRDGATALAECDPCDVFFEFNVDEVYAA